MQGDGRTRGQPEAVRRTPWVFETSRCEASVSPEAVEFRFTVTDPDSAARSEMVLSVGRHDLPALLEEIAFEMPEATEWMAAAILTAARERRLEEENRLSRQRRAGLAG